MNIAKNMEIIFIAAAFIGVTAAASAAPSSAQAARTVIQVSAVSAISAVAAPAPMQTVIVSAKRLTAAQKAML